MNESERYDEVCKPAFKVLFDKLDAIHTCVKGDNGLYVRTDRLEQSEKSRQKIQWIIIGAIAVILVNAVWGLLTKIEKTEPHQTNGAKP